MPPKRASTTDNDEFESRKRERQSEVVSKIQDLDGEGAMAYLETICRRWKLVDHHAADLTFQDAIELAFSNFGMDLSSDIISGDMASFGLKSLDENIHDHEMELISLYHKLREHKMLDDPNVLRKCTTCLEQVYYSKRTVLNAFQSKLSVHQLQSTTLEDGKNPFDIDKELDARLGSWSLRFRWINDDTVPVQKLLLHMLDRAMEKRYRRQGDWCFEPIIVNGHDTHAWRAVTTIEQWMYTETAKETNWEQWQWLTAAGGTPRTVKEYLSKCCDYSFPELKKDRSTFAFLNGVYRARENKFYPHESSTLANSIAACKFFELEFPADYIQLKPEEIPTPNLDTIMDFQEWSSDVKKWMYILLGRLLYDLNDLDAWQVIPFCKGLASSGKCFAAGTEVLMYDGAVKKVEDIVPGDLVMGDDSTSRKVLDLARGTEELYKISTKKFGSMMVTKEHVLCLKYRKQVFRERYVDWWDGFSFKYKQISDPDELQAYLEDKDQCIEMTVEQYLNTPASHKKNLRMYHVGRLEFPEPATPLFHPYAIGAWLGDGHTNGSRFTNFSQEVVDTLNEIGTEYGMCVGDTSAIGTFGYNQIQGRDKFKNSFLQALRAYNLINNKHIPQLLLTASSNDRLELLAGLLDTDGYRGPSDLNGYEITQKVEAVATGITFLAMSLGFGTTKKAVQKSWWYQGQKKTSMYHKVTIFGDGIEDIPCRIPKKQAVPGKRQTNALVYGFTVTPVPGPQSYFGFQTDGNQRFCLADGTVTHNSTVTLKVAKQFYDDIDCGNMSNNIETKFGLSQFHDKLLFVAPEIKSDLKIEQAEFQSIVSGEDITINIKGVTAISKTWNTPGILAGNEVPSWCDNSGSIQRRIILFDFPRQVTNGDMRLGDKLAAEIPAILLKCNAMYLEAVSKWSSTNIWTVLPKYFIHTRDEMAQATNVLEAFLCSESVIMKEGAFCSMDDFKTALKTFAQQNNFAVKRFNWEFFRGPMDKFHITRAREQRVYQGKKVTREYLDGVDLASFQEENVMG